jgi:hypothetical protein
MPFKSKAQRRKFAELLVNGDITPETYEEWNRETGSATLPEYVNPKGRRASKGKKKAKPKVRAKGRSKATGRSTPRTKRTKARSKAKPRSRPKATSRAKSTRKRS